MDNLQGQPSYWSKPPLPAFVKAALILPDPGQQALDLKPHAAYLLGYLSFGVRFWLATSWKFAESEAHWGRLGSTIKELRGAMTALSAVIHPNTFFELDHAINNFIEKIRRMIGPSAALTSVDADVYRSRNVQLRNECEGLKALVDQALDPTRELHRLFEFGSSLGELQLWLWDYGPGSVFDQDELERYYNWIEGGGSDPLPDIRPLVRSALRLPQGVVNQIPYVATLVSLAPLLEGTERDKFLKTYSRRHVELSPILAVAEEVDHAAVALMLENLDVAIRAWLGSSDVEVGSPLPLDEQAQLSWDKIAGKLRLGTRVIGSFRPQATNARKVLERFQSHQPSWPRQIPNFFEAEGDSERTKETLRTLRKINTIKFTGDYYYISWDWAEEG